MSPSRTVKRKSPDGGGVVRLADDPLVEHPHGLLRVHVVQDDAPAAAHDHELADLVRVGPADVDVADDATGVAEGDEADVLAGVAEEAGADGARPLGRAAEEVGEDRHVVARQVPDRVDVVADRAEVRPPGVEVVDLAHRGCWTSSRTFATEPL
jgi:hypothetical protein